MVGSSPGWLLRAREIEGLSVTVDQLADDVVVSVTLLPEPIKPVLGLIFELNSSDLAQFSLYRLYSGCRPL